jgi:hypothetical protein
MIMFKRATAWLAIGLMLTACPGLPPISLGFDVAAAHAACGGDAATILRCEVDELETTAPEHLERDARNVAKQANAFADTAGEKLSKRVGRQKTALRNVTKFVADVDRLEGRGDLDPTTADDMRGRAARIRTQIVALLPDDCPCWTAKQLSKVREPVCDSVIFGEPRIQGLGALKAVKGFSCKPDEKVRALGAIEFTTTQCTPQGCQDFSVPACFCDDVDASGPQFFAISEQQQASCHTLLEAGCRVVGTPVPIPSPTPACTPTQTCASEGRECGTFVDDCGNEVACGTCDDANAATHDACVQGACEFLPDDCPCFTGAELDAEVVQCTQNQGATLVVGPADLACAPDTRVATLTSDKCTCEPADPQLPGTAMSLTPTQRQHCVDLALARCDRKDLCPDDPAKIQPGRCGCGRPDDANRNGFPDCAEIVIGPAVIFNDTDGDGVTDDQDGCDMDPAKTGAGKCGCGRSDADANTNGVADCREVVVDATIYEIEDLVITIEPIPDFPDLRVASETSVDMTIPDGLHYDLTVSNVTPNTIAKDAHVTFKYPLGTTLNGPQLSQTVRGVTQRADADGFPVLDIFIGDLPAGVVFTAHILITGLTDELIDENAVTAFRTEVDCTVPTAEDTSTECRYFQIATPSLGEVRGYFNGVDPTPGDNYASHLLAPIDFVGINIIPPSEMKKKCKEGEYGKWSTLLDNHCDKNVELAARISVAVAALIVAGVISGGAPLWAHIAHGGSKWAVLAHAGERAGGILAAAAY